MATLKPRVLQQVQDRTAPTTRSNQRCEFKFDSLTERIMTDYKKKHASEREIMASVELLPRAFPAITLSNSPIAHASPTSISLPPEGEIRNTYQVRSQAPLEACDSLPCKRL